jgi:hypothetical protein
LNVTIGKHEAEDQPLIPVFTVFSNFPQGLWDVTTMKSSQHTNFRFFSMANNAFFVFSIVMCTTTVAGLSTTQEFLPPARFAVVHCWRGLSGEEAWCQASFFGWPVSEQLTSC